MGNLNLAGRLAGNASSLYAKNLQNFIELMIGEDGNLKIDWDDEIMTGCGLIRDGAVVHPILST